MKTNKRKFISIYFSDNPLVAKKKRDLTLAFEEKSALYKKCKNMGSSEVKNLIGISSYKQLFRNANKDGRSLGNYIKYRLAKKLGVANE